MARPTSNNGNMLQPVKGWDSPMLDIALPVSANVTIDVYAGSVLHINSSKEAELGLDDDGVGLFAFSNDYDPHVAGAGVDLDSYSNKDVAYTGAFPRPNKGVLQLLVATGGYEIETTEWVTAQKANYTPNKPLTAPTGNTLGTSGVLTPGKHYLNPCCGVVSRGIVPSGVDATGDRESLAFWTTHVPTLSAARIAEIEA